MPNSGDMTTGPDGKQYRWSPNSGSWETLDKFGPSQNQISQIQNGTTQQPQGPPINQMNPNTGQQQGPEQNQQMVQLLQQLQQAKQNPFINQSNNPWGGQQGMIQQQPQAAFGNPTINGQRPQQPQIGQQNRQNLMGGLAQGIMGMGGQKPQPFGGNFMQPQQKPQAQQDNSWNPGSIR